MEGGFKKPWPLFGPCSEEGSGSNSRRRRRLSVGLLRRYPHSPAGCGSDAPLPRINCSRCARGRRPHCVRFRFR
ncbi:hypothetical protein chiPu_0028755, partial [Chiloscyllium punctatum]|nr:hypothetical protein [Chiloscyllium punctatum]